jgi:hypothetical protein
MNMYAHAVRPGWTLLAVALLSLAPAMASARSVRDSKEFSDHLAEARAEAIQLQQNAEEMSGFVHSHTKWATESSKIEEVKQHVNKLAEYIAEMNKAEAPSPWQEQASSDVTPMVNDLSAYVTMAIYYLTENQDRFAFTSFPEYVAANAASAADIAHMLSDYVAYGEAKQKAEDVSFELQREAWGRGEFDR